MPFFDSYVKLPEGNGNSDIQKKNVSTLKASKVAPEKSHIPRFHLKFCVHILCCRVFSPLPLDGHCGVHFGVERSYVLTSIYYFDNMNEMTMLDMITSDHFLSWITLDLHHSWFHDFISVRHPCHERTRLRHEVSADAPGSLASHRRRQGHPSFATGMSYMNGMGRES